MSVPSYIVNMNQYTCQTSATVKRENMYTKIISQNKCKEVNNIFFILFLNYCQLVQYSLCNRRYVKLLKINKYYTNLKQSSKGIFVYRVHQEVNTCYV